MIAVFLISLLIIATLLSAAWTLYSVRKLSAKNRLLCSSTILLLAAATTCATLRHVGFFGDNFHTVREGECYRSAQMSSEQLRSKVQEFGIKTVINLRGESKKSWFTAEAQTLQSLGVSMLNISMNNQHIPSPDRLVLLIESLKTAPRPILLHCNHGVDRTGFAAVLYKAVVNDQPLSRAIAEENSVFTGHIRTHNNSAGDLVFDLYRKSSAGLSIEEWSRTNYAAQFALVASNARATPTQSWLNTPMRFGSLVLTPFKALGILGASLFACRWFVQAYYSRRAGRPVTPLNFWLISIFGSALMLVYFCFSPKQDIVGIISNLFPATVAAYNVFLELRHRARERLAQELRQPAAKLQSVV